LGSQFKFDSERPVFPEGERKISTVKRLIICLAVALGLASSVHGREGPASSPTTTSREDPIGALLAEQALKGPQSSIPVVIGLRMSETTQRTRFAIELSDPLDVRVYTLTNPNRVVIDMPDVLWRAGDEARPSGRRAVRSYRYGQFRKGNFRFVVDLNTPVKVEAPQLIPPEEGFGFRLVIDLTASTSEAFVASAGWPRGAATGSAFTLPAPAISAPPRTADANKRLVVVDAGHGGIDPGTQGRSGIREKDLVLGVARELRKALEATGRYRVQLTRDSDVFIPLRERVNVARAAHADLFISLHADSNDHSDIRGASVYTLSEDASDREAASLAEKENMSDVIAGVDLAGESSPVASILIDLAQRDTMNRSVRFAERVLTALPRATMVRPTSPHRSAGFAVLKAPDIPAALIELGYLSNPDDETEMIKPAWRTKVAGSLVAAINNHFSAEAGLPGRQAAVP
jgi:N-acetylmuramoyl-L-alanine amidase